MTKRANQPVDEPKLEEEPIEEPSEKEHELTRKVDALRQALYPFAFDALRLSGDQYASHNVQVPEAYIAAARAALE